MINPSWPTARSFLLFFFADTLPETNIAPENGWLEYFLVSFWDGLSAGAMLVPGSVHLLKHK